MGEHTKGPWRVDETKSLGAYGVWTDYPTHPGHDGAGYESQICSMGPVVRSEITREQRDANARLIAAAPDLLAACKAHLAVVEHFEHCTGGCGADLYGNVWYCPERKRLTMLATGLAERAIAAAEVPPDAD